MAARKNAELPEGELFPEPEVKESPRSKGNYHDGKPIDIETAFDDRPYSEAVTDEQRELAEKYGQPVE